VVAPWSSKCGISEQHRLTDTVAKGRKLVESPRNLLSRSCQSYLDVAPCHDGGRGCRDHMACNALPAQHAAKYSISKKRGVEGVVLLRALIAVTCQP